jgi:hypothetical protein
MSCALVRFLTAWLSIICAEIRGAVIRVTWSLSQTLRTCAVAMPINQAIHTVSMGISGHQKRRSSAVAAESVGFVFESSYDATGAWVSESTGQTMGTADADGQCHGVSNGSCTATRNLLLVNVRTERTER